MLSSEHTTQAFAGGPKKLIILTTSNQLLSASYIGFDIHFTDTVRLQPTHFLGCSCLLHSDTCSVPSAFYSYDERDNSFAQLEIVTGVELACLPLLSFLQSSLVCWYSQQCYHMLRCCSMKILQKKVFFLILLSFQVIEFWQNRTESFTVIPSKLDSSARSHVNASTLLLDMVNQLPVENGSRQINCIPFSEGCAIAYCFCSTTEQPDIVAIATRFIALFGGFNIALKLVASWIIKAMVWSVNVYRGQYIDHILWRQ